jgi:hypothetical protein
MSIDNIAHVLQSHTPDLPEPALAYLAGCWLAALSRGSTVIAEMREEDS